jgi:peptide-methionine (S)-S-oxide reductase
MERMLVGGGCFWCVEGAYKQLRGVESALPAYAGGHDERPTYRAVCSGSTGHAEIVEVVYDPQVIDYETLLEVFFTVHDPTQLNRQGNDIGTQYRSCIMPAERYPTHAC